MKRTLYTLAMLLVCGVHTVVGNGLYTRAYQASELISNAQEIGFGDEAKDRPPVERALIALGVEFPEGASAVASNGQKLVLRTTLAGHEVTEVYLRSIRDSAETQLHIVHEQIEIEKRHFSKWLSTHRMPGNADALRTELQEWITDGRAAVYNVSVITTRSGRRAKTTAAEYYVYPTTYDQPQLPNKVELSGDARAPIIGVQGTSFELRNVGTAIEVDPVLGADGVTIDLNLAPEVVTHAGETVWPHPMADALRRMTFPKFHASKITTQISQIDGHYFLLGTTEPVESSAGFSDSLLVHFIRSDVGRPGLAGGTDTILSDFEPAPETASNKDEFTDRTFTVHPLVFSSNAEQASVRQVLQNAGVRFERGAAAIYNPATKTLFARNTEEQLERINSFVESVIVDTDRQLLITTEFIEVSQTLASEWLAENPQTSGANQLREQAEQWMDAADAKLLHLASITARSGQRAKTEAVTEYIYGTEMSPGEVPNEIVLNDGAEGPMVGATPTAFDTRNLGLTMEVDPVIGADGYTIDLNLAPEVTTFMGLDLFPSAEANPAVQIALPQFHQLKGTTQITMGDGNYELLYTARPHQPSDGLIDTVVLVFVRADLSHVGTD